MAEDVTIWQEIDEALRAEKLERFWGRYGLWVIIVCTLIVLASAVSVVWKNHRRAVHETETTQLIEATTLAQKGKYEDAVSLYEKIEAEGGALSTLAALRHAQALSALHQDDKALALYGDIAQGKKGGGPASLRDFAYLQNFIFSGNNAIKTNNPLTGAKKDNGNGGIFSSTVTELNALQTIRAGDNKSAAAALLSIMNDENAPLSQRARAAEILGSVREPGK